MKKAILITAAVLGVSILSFSANESKETNSQKIDLGNFYGIIVNANANVIIEQSENHSIRIEGTPKQLKNVRTNINDGTLLIENEDALPVTIHIYADDLNLIEINKKAKAWVSGTLNTDILLLKASEFGSIKADIRALKIGVIAKDHSKIIVAGSCGDFFSRIYGNAHINTDNLDAFNTTNESL